MTKEFRELMDAMDKPKEQPYGNLALNGFALGNFIANYQIAVSLIDIDKDLKQILQEMRKRKV